MNTYQQKWIDTLRNAHIPGWYINPQYDGIHVVDLKLISCHKRWR